MLRYVFPWLVFSAFVTRIATTTTTTTVLSFEHEDNENTNKNTTINNNNMNDARRKKKETSRLLTASKSKQSSFRPHIVMIVMDDLGSHDLGFHGTDIQTPHSDDLARSGLYLDKYYVTPYCSPTRAALLSGKYPLHTGVSHWIRSQSTMGLPLKDETLPEILQRSSSSQKERTSHMDYVQKRRTKMDVYNTTTTTTYASHDYSKIGSGGISSSGSGYRTHAVGKWHIGHSKWSQTPTWRGFDSFFGFYGGGQDYFTHRSDTTTSISTTQDDNHNDDSSSSSSYYDLRWDPHPYINEHTSRIVNETGNYSTHVFTREAIRRIEEHAQEQNQRRSKWQQQQQQRQIQQQKMNERETTKGYTNLNDQPFEEQPLFLYLAYQAVHCPNQVPQEYIDRYKQHQDWTDQRKNYAGMLTAADEGIGNVLRTLQKHKLWENTLIIFTTDNGGPTESCCIQGSSNYPKRGGKCTIWDGGTTGDGFLSGPAMKQLGIPTGQRYPHLVHVVDWLPTLAEMVGVIPRKAYDLDGKSHWASLTGQSDTYVRNELFVGYVKNDATQQWYGPAIRVDNWKLIQGLSGGPDAKHPAPNGTDKLTPGGISNSSYLLFDLENDPGEEVDLSAKYPEIVQRLRYHLQIYQQTYVEPQSNDDSNCPFPGYVNTSMGPTLMPWCQGAKEVVFYD